MAEELRELDAALAASDRAEVERELGDLLFAVANLARKVGVAPEEALRGTLRRFVARFEHVERSLAGAGVAHGQATPEQLDALWNEAKARGL